MYCVLLKMDREFKQHVIVSFVFVAVNTLSHCSQIIAHWLNILTRRVYVFVGIILRLVGILKEIVSNVINHDVPFLSEGEVLC